MRRIGAEVDAKEWRPTTHTQILRAAAEIRAVGVPGGGADDAVAKVVVSDAVFLAAALDAESAAAVLFAVRIADADTSLGMAARLRGVAVAIDAALAAGIVAELLGRDVGRACRADALPVGLAFPAARAGRDTGAAIRDTGAADTGLARAAASAAANASTAVSAAGLASAVG